MNKLKIRLLSSILALVLTLSSLPLYAVSPELTDAGEEVLQAADSTEYSSDGVFITAEDTSKRGEFEKHYLCSDGTFIAVSYPEAVHYQNENGEWEEVDNELHYDSTVSRYATSNEDFTVSFAGQAARENLISLSSNGFELSWSLAAGGFAEDGSALILESSGKTSLAAQLKTQSAASLTADSASELQISDADTFAAVGISGEIAYPRLFEDAPEISVDYTVYHNKIEEDIYINSATDIRSFRMTLDAGELTAVLMDDGSVEFVDADGAVQYRVGIPYMEDAAFAVLNDIEVTVEQNGGDCVITYTPDEEWFTSSDRVYPIMLDPSITTGEYNSNLVDTYVVQGDTSNHSSQQRLHIGVNSSKIERTYLKVNNLPIIDSSMPILSATMTLALWTGTTTGKTVDVYKASAAWDPSTITYANQPALVSSNKLASCAFDASNLYYTFDLSSNVAQLYDEFTAAVNYGYVLKYQDESLTDPDFNSLYSSEYTKKAYRPVIKIVYGYALPSELEEGGIYSFQNVGSSSFLTVHNGTDANDTNVYQYSTTIANLANNQKFKLEYVESTGSYIFRAMCSSSGTNRVLDIVKSNGYVENGGNVQIYVNDDPIAQEWLIVGLGSLSFKIIPRSNMSLALSAYPSSANGTSSGTTSTSAGNIFVSTYSGTSDYQEWYIIDESGDYKSSDAQLLSDVPYYFNNKYYGKYLYASGSLVPSVKSGLISDLGNSIRWKITHIGDGEYTIQLLSNLTKYLYVPNSGILASTVYTATDEIPDIYRWKITIAKGGGTLIQNVAYSQYLFTNGSTVGVSSTLGDAGSNTYYTRVWRAASTDYYGNDKPDTTSYRNELRSGFTISDMSIEALENLSPTINKNPSNALWASPSDFTFSTQSTTPSGCVYSNNTTHQIQGKGYGSATVQATHKVTGLSYTFNVTVTCPAVVIPCVYGATPAYSEVVNFPVYINSYINGYSSYLSGVTWYPYENGAMVFDSESMTVKGISSGFGWLEGRKNGQTVFICYVYSENILKDFDTHVQEYLYINGTWLGTISCYEYEKDHNIDPLILRTEWYLYAIRLLNKGKTDEEIQAGLKEKFGISLDDEYTFRTFISEVELGSKGGYTRENIRSSFDGALMMLNHVWGLYATYTLATLDTVNVYTPATMQDVLDEEAYARNLCKTSRDIISQAKYAQTSGGYSADNFQPTLLKKGTIVCGLLDGQTAWYTTPECIAASGYDTLTLYSKLQISVGSKGYRTKVAFYEITDDILVATGIVQNNTNYGVGGYTQYYIPNFKEILNKISETLLK